MYHMGLLVAFTSVSSHPKSYDFSFFSPLGSPLDFSHTFSTFISPVSATKEKKYDSHGFDDFAVLLSLFLSSLQLLGIFNQLWEVRVGGKGGFIIWLAGIVLFHFGTSMRGESGQLGVLSAFQFWAFVFLFSLLLSLIV